MEKKNNSTFIAISTAYFIVLFGIIFYFFFLKNYIDIPSCPIYTYFGIYCPACGGTRAVISFLNFDLTSSLLYNPIILYSLFFSTLYLITESINIFFHKKIDINFNIIIKIGIIILFFNCIIKNIFIILNKI